MKTYFARSRGIITTAISFLFVFGLIAIGTPEAFAQKGGAKDPGATVKNADGTTTTTFKDGSSVTTYPEGTTVKGGEDNGQDITYPPGTTKKTEPSNDYGKGGTRETYTTPKGKGQGRTDVFVTDKNGNKRYHKVNKHWPNGSTMQSTMGYRPDGSKIGGEKEMKDPDGTTTTTESEYKKDGSGTEKTTVKGSGGTTEVTKEISKDAGKDAGKEAGKEAGKDAARDAAKDAAKGAKPPEEGPVTCNPSRPTPACPAP